MEVLCEILLTPNSFPTACELSEYVCYQIAFKFIGTFSFDFYIIYGF